MRSTTTWTAVSAVNRDVVEVFVVRYWWADRSEPAMRYDRPIRMQHLRASGGWHDHGEFHTIQPALSIPGHLAHNLPTMHHAYPTLAEQQIMALLEKVVARA